MLYLKYARSFHYHYQCPDGQLVRQRQKRKKVEMASRVTKAQLLADLAVANTANDKLEGDLAASERELKGLRSRNEGLGRMVEGQGEAIKELRQTIVNYEDEARRRDQVIVDDGATKRRLSHDLEQARQDLYLSTDTLLNAVADVAFLLGLPVMRQQSIISAIASLKDAASKAGVQMTDEFISAARMTLTRSAGAVIEDEMSQQTPPTMERSSDPLIAAIMRLMSRD